MLKIGLTGGIGCGKTTVANHFADLAVPVLDADLVAHRLVAAGQPALAELAEVFGESILNPDGSLNRGMLRELVFSDKAQKQQLEAIVHPLVYRELQAELDQLSVPYSIVCVPLLFETGMQHFVDRVLVVDCPVEIQIERVLRRDAINSQTIEAMIASQVTREFRNTHADDLIDNTGPDSALAEQVKKLHNFYLSICDC